MRNTLVFNESIKIFGLFGNKSSSTTATITHWLFNAQYGYCENSLKYFCLDLVRRYIFKKYEVLNTHALQSSISH